MIHLKSNSRKANVIIYSITEVSTKSNQIGHDQIQVQSLLDLILGAVRVNLLGLAGLMLPGLSHDI